MFGFIRNIFRDALFIFKGSGGQFAPPVFAVSDWPNFLSLSYKHSESLTQRDLQILTHIVSKHIKAADQVRKEIKEEALTYEVKDTLRHLLFKEHREVKAYLKKLAALQHRLKHKIIAKA